MKRKKTILQWLLIIIAIFSIRAYQQQDLNHESTPLFHSKTLTGEVLSSHSKNQPTLIHFWATWCGVCRLENANIQTVSRDYRVLNIAMQSGTDADLKQYAQEHNMQLDNIINDNSGSLAKLFGVSATPSSFFVTKNGKIKFIEVGYVTTLGYLSRLWWLGL